MVKDYVGFHENWKQTDLNRLRMYLKGVESAIRELNGVLHGGSFTSKERLIEELNRLSLYRLILLNRIMIEELRDKIPLT